MTLVLPASFCGDQISNSYSHHHHCGSARNTSPSVMPCVFDSDALDFESALMTDWTSDISDYDAAEEPIKAPSGPNNEKELKRKNSIDGNSSEPKKLKKDEASSPPSSPEVIVPQPHRIVHVHTGHHHHHHHLPPSPLTISHSRVDLENENEENDDKENEEEEEEVADEEEEEEEFFPRRRVVPQMWNSRQRWKDERKKVLKMSIGKLAEIEDPELWLLRSVLINNTIKKLHLDIRNERQAKLRHRQQRMDYFAERFQSLSTPEQEQEPTSETHEDDPSPQQEDSPSKPASSELYDDTSCDEIFGISEDFLRVTIPDRRVSSPLPDTRMDTTTTADKQPKTDCGYANSSCDTISPFYRPRTLDYGPTEVDSSSSTSRRHVGPAAASGVQCATQFRTNRVDCGGGVDNTFPPRVPILDSVVYHSLLASLESS